MDILRKIAERRIEEAMREGQFEGLSGKGRPLRLDDDRFVPEELRLAYRVLKNAEFLPPELELKKEILGLRRLMETIDDDSERLKKLRELDFKLMKLEMLLNRPLNLGEYENRVFEKKVG